MDCWVNQKIHVAISGLIVIIPGKCQVHSGNIRLSRIDVDLKICTRRTIKTKKKDETLKHSQLPPGTWLKGQNKGHLKAMSHIMISC